MHYCEIGIVFCCLATFIDIVDYVWGSTDHFGGITPWLLWVGRGGATQNKFLAPFSGFDTLSKMLPFLGAKMTLYFGV